MNVEKAKDYYVSTAIISFNFLALFVVLNVAIGAAYFIRSLFLAPNPVAAKYRETQLSKVYPGKSLRQINALLAETWSSRPLVYESFTQFKERPYRGQYVNVDEHGFRFSVNQASWPPDPSTLNVFVFGGSTTFGYGVADEETIPSFLQEEIHSNTGSAAVVYNFARGHYYSTQELILFEKLLAAGHRPNLAIFIDGLNDFNYVQDDPEYAERLQDFMADQNFVAGTALGDKNDKNLLPFVARLPVVRLLTGVAHRAGWPGKADFEPGPLKKAELESAASIVLNRYRANKKMIEAIAAAYGVAPFFVWQPVPTYKYDLNSHLFPVSNYGGHVVAASAYTMLAANRQKEPIAANSFWCQDIQEGRHEPLYVDDVHYTAAFSKDIAACIARQLRSAGIIPAKNSP